MISFYQNMTFLVLDVKLRRLRYISLQKERHPKIVSVETQLFFWWPQNLNSRQSASGSVCSYVTCGMFGVGVELAVLVKSRTLHNCCIAG